MEGGGVCVGVCVCVWIWENDKHCAACILPSPDFETSFHIVLVRGFFDGVEHHVDSQVDWHRSSLTGMAPRQYKVRAQLASRPLVVSAVV